MIHLHFNVGCSGIQVQIPFDFTTGLNGTPVTNCNSYANQHSVSISKTCNYPMAPDIPHWLEMNTSAEQ
jgi:hypothetical protein